MAGIPLLFRDLIEDQHSLLGLNSGDLLSVLGAGFRRPFLSARPKQATDATEETDKEKFELILDVQQFAPKEVSVKVEDKFVVIEAKHDEKQDDHGFVSRQFSRRYLLPESVNPNLLISKISSDGLLTVTTSSKQLPPPAEERSIPITQTGQPAKKDEPEKKDEPITKDVEVKKEEPKTIEVEVKKEEQVTKDVEVKVEVSAAKQEEVKEDVEVAKEEETVKEDLPVAEKKDEQVKQEDIVKNVESETKVEPEKKDEPVKEDVAGI